MYCTILLDLKWLGCGEREIYHSLYYPSLHLNADGLLKEKEED
jgi:hypothetical protein